MKRTTLLIKVYLDEPPLLYIEDQSTLPEWKKFWLGLLKNEELMGKSRACLDAHKKANHCSEDGWTVFSNLLKTEYKEYYEMYNSLPKEHKEVVWGNVALRHLDHTYDPDENCVSINREQVRINTTRDILSFVNTSLDHTKSIYQEKEEDGQVWSYLFKQEIDSNGAKKQVESWKNHATDLRYMVVNKDFAELQSSNKMITVNGEEYPEYLNIVEGCIEHEHPKYYGWSLFLCSIDPYSFCDYICERDGKMLYYAVGQHSEDDKKQAKIVLKTIEYKEDDQNYRVDIPADAQPAQVRKLLRKLIKSPNLNVIRIIGGETDRETVVYKNEEKFFIMTKDSTGVRYTRRREIYSLDLVQEFGICIPEMCIYSYSVSWTDSFLHGVLENIIGSDHGYERISWVYFVDGSIEIKLPELDFSGAKSVALPKPSTKVQVTCTEFEYKVNRRNQSLGEEKLETMTSKKMYNLAVKKLETGKLEYLSISAACEDEGEKNLVLYGDGTRFSVGIFDNMEESALCYDNGSGDSRITELGGQDFPNTMITDDAALLKDIIKCFCDKCQPLDSVRWVV